MNNSKKSSKKNNVKANEANEASEAKKGYTIEDLKKDFLTCNSDLLELSKKLGCKYAAAHKNFDGTAKQGARTRIQLIVDGVTKQFDKVELQKLTDTYNPKTTPKTGDRATSKDPESLEAKAAEYEAKAAELRARAKEIRKARAEAEASQQKVTEAANNIKFDGLTVEEQKQLLKVLKMHLAKA